MPVNECHPFYTDGRISYEATAAVTGKRFLKISGSRESGPGLSTTAEGGNYRMAQAVAGDKAVGVSDKDVPSGEKGVCLGQPGWVLPVTSGAAIAAGAEVQADAAGKAVTLAAGKSLGVCMTAVGGADVDAEIKLT
jgi:hypothetical protein